MSQTGKNNRSHAFQIGRLCVVNQGSNAGKVCTVLDIVDQSRALVDGPVAVTGLKRQTIPLTWLSITNIAFKCPRGARPSTLAKHLEKYDIINQYNNTARAKKVAASKVRANLSDFQRFQVLVLRKKRAKAINTSLKALKKAKA